jgi:hypothetical protein
VKIHLLLDNEGYLPCFAHITDGKSHDITVGRALRFAPGTIVAMDKGYVDYRWWKQITEDGAYFVSRLKEDLHYEVLKERKLPQKSPVPRDCWIRIAATPQRPFELVLRLVTIFDEDKQQELTFITSHLGFGATTIARIYKERRQIELFFKALKQLVRVKTFVGTSANALKTQIRAALIAMLLLKCLPLRSRFGWSLSNLLATIRQQLFAYRELYGWLDDPFQPPPALAGVHDRQLPLEWQGAAGRGGQWDSSPAGRTGKPTEKGEINPEPGQQDLNHKPTSTVRHPNLPVPNGGRGELSPISPIAHCCPPG